MGVWGDTLFEDDFTQDVRDCFEDAYKKDRDISNALLAVNEKFSVAKGDPDEGPLRILALTALLIEHDYLRSDYRREALYIIKNEQGMERWKEAGGEEYAKRKEIYAHLKGRIKRTAMPLHLHEGDRHERRLLRLQREMCEVFQVSMYPVSLDMHISATDAVMQGEEEVIALRVAYNGEFSGWLMYCESDGEEPKYYGRYALDVIIARPEIADLLGLPMGTVVDLRTNEIYRDNEVLKVAREHLSQRKKPL